MTSTKTKLDRALTSPTLVSALAHRGSRPHNLVLRADAVGYGSNPTRRDRVAKTRAQLAKLTGSAREACQRRLDTMLAEGWDTPELKAPAAAQVPARPRAAAPAAPTKAQLTDACHRLAKQHQIFTAQKSALGRAGRLKAEQFNILQTLRGHLPCEVPRDEPPSPTWSAFASAMSKTAAELSKLSHS